MGNKIGLLTLPPRVNYGGILQAYALKKNLEKFGFEVTLLRRISPRPNFIRKCLSHFKTILMRVAGKKRKFTHWISDEEFDIIAKHTRMFTDKNFPITKTFYSSETFSKFLISENFDHLIVGSDQVWRPAYVANIYDYFFNTDLPKCKKIAYAASIGVEAWPYSTLQSQRISRYLEKFNAISFREKQTVDLFESQLGVDSVHVLDPTMLLSTSDYLELIEPGEESTRSGVFTYILDENEEKRELIKNICLQLNLESYSNQPFEMDLNQDVGNNIDKFTYPSVTSWIDAVNKASFIVTDSFHGCVFSIIFNKPFLAISNKSKGIARFKSLLETFGLMSRLDNLGAVNQSIDWDRVNLKRKELKEYSLNFLKHSLR